MLKLYYIVRNKHFIPLYFVSGDLPKNFRNAPAAADDIFSIHSYYRRMLIGLIFYTRCLRKHYTEITRR